MSDLLSGSFYKFNFTFFEYCTERWDTLGE